MPPGSLADEVHLWWSPLDPPPGRRAALVGLLSSAERERAAGLSSPVARRRWAVARGTLRAVLARYTGTSPDRFRIDREPGGRPFVPLLGLHFSLSHAGDRVLIAVGATAELGVDVELVRPLAALEAMARRCLSPAERATFDRVPTFDRPRSFLLRWTRKEACLKAAGLGLRVEPASVEPGMGEFEGWMVRGLEPERGYVGALAVRPAAARITERGPA